MDFVKNEKMGSDEISNNYVNFIATIRNCLKNGTKPTKDMLYVPDIM